MWIVIRSGDGVLRVRNCKSTRLILSKLKEWFYLSQDSTEGGFRHCDHEG